MTIVNPGDAPRAAINEDNPMAKSKRPSKKKATKKKAAKRKPAKKNPARGPARGQKGSSGAMARSMKGYARPKTMKGIIDKWSRVRERTAALQCKDMATCGWYIDALLDALDTAMGAWTQFGQDVRLQKKEIKQLEAALDKTEGQLKTAKAKLKASKKMSAGDRTSIGSVLDSLTREVKALRTDVRKVARGRQISLAPRAAAKPRRISRPKKAPRARQLALPRTPGGHAAYTASSGAGCSLAAVRWGYSGPEDCAPKGYKPSDAGRRLANIRWWGVPLDRKAKRNPEGNPSHPAGQHNPSHPVAQFNPSEYYEMGYEDGRRSSKGAAPKRAAPKRKAPKRGSPTSSTSDRAAAARANRALARI